MTAAGHAHPHVAHERIPGNDVVAAFDFDGTLTRGGSVWQFLTAMCGRDAVVSAGISLFPKLVRAALFGGGAADEAKEALFVRTLAGRPAEEIGRARRGLRRRPLPPSPPHQGTGPARLAPPPGAPRRGGVGVSGVLRPPRGRRARCGRRGRHPLGGRPQRKAHRPFRGRQLPGGAKARPADAVDGGLVGSTARRRRCPRRCAARMHDTGPPFLWAYGNSAGDREMLEAADIGVDAGRLGRLGKLRGFRRLGDVLTAW